VSSSGGVLKAAYGYDGLNRRISEQVAANAAGDAATAAIRDLFYSADWQVLEERLRSGGAVGATAEARYVWSPVYVDAMVLRERGSERVYALQDGNWNTTALIAASGVPGKATGDLIQRMVYNPYGEVFLLNPDWTEQLGTPLVPWQHLFQGLKFTEATGLGYVRNRDYSPTLGRFIMLDPIGFSAGDNNWYRFVGNGPVGRVDPFGLQLVVSGPGPGTQTPVPTLPPMPPVAPCIPYTNIICTSGSPQENGTHIVTCVDACGNVVGKYLTHVERNPWKCCSDEIRDLITQEKALLSSALWVLSACVPSGRRSSSGHSSSASAKLNCGAAWAALLADIDIYSKLSQRLSDCYSNNRMRPECCGDRGGIPLPNPEGVNPKK
jgi:RHS repeat-associated protein